MKRPTNNLKNFTIDNEVPIPPAAKFKKYNFPFLDLDKGQSFIISAKESSALRSVINTFSKKNPQDSRYWTIRRIAPFEYRCWRVF